jgi:2-polyprenyl-3-methyl-5-hydroxy-6-metoxy-1,4-benzoquinol methylase
VSKRKHVYDYEVDLNSDVAPARVIRMVRPGSKVLEIGAGPGSITRHLTGTLGCETVALEVDPAAIEVLRTYVPRVYASDLNNPAWCDQIREECGLFDYVIAADVLEHVYNPWQVLDGMTSLLADGGAVILSLPHVGHAAVAACLVDEDFEYWPWGLLDRTHIRFFGVKNVQALINGAGLAIEDAQFVVRTPLMTEFAARWKRMPADVQAALQRNRYSHVLQVVTCSRKSADPRAGIDLMTLTPTPPDAEAVAYWTDAMSRQTSPAEVDLRSPLDAPQARTVKTIAPGKPMHETKMQKLMRRTKRKLSRIF